MGFSDKYEVMVHGLTWMICGYRHYRRPASHCTSKELS